MTKSELIQHIADLNPHLYHRVVERIVTTIFDEERGLSIVLPEQGQEAEVSPKNILTLIVQPTGIVEIKRGESQQIQRATPSEIGAIWRFEVGQNENLIAAVKTAPGTPYRFMIDVLDQLQAAGAERVNLGLATEQEPIVYLPPWTALGFSAASSVVLRTQVEPQTLTATARAAVRDAGGSLIYILRINGAKRRSNAGSKRNSWSLRSMNLANASKRATYWTPSWIGCPTPCVLYLFCSSSKSSPWMKWRFYFLCLVVR